MESRENVKLSVRKKRACTLIRHIENGVVFIHPGAVDGSDFMSHMNL